MNICINYAHGDKEFVDQLAIQLSREIDCGITLWEMPAGDSLIEEDKSNSVEIDAIIILLSEESSATEWCQKKLCAELLHKIEDQGTAVILVMIDECEIPEFARSEPITDFRNGAVDDIGRIARLVVWSSAWRKEISFLSHQELLSGKSPDECQIQRFDRPFIRRRLIVNDDGIIRTFDDFWNSSF